MPGENNEFELLYNIEALGLEKLDGIAANQQKIALETRFSKQELEAFENVLRATAANGTGYAKALQEIAKSTAESDRANRAIAQTILANDRAQQNRIRSIQQEEKAWRSLQMAHQAALNEEGRRQKAAQAEELLTGKNTFNGALGASMLLGGNRYIGSAFGARMLAGGLGLEGGALAGAGIGLAGIGALAGVVDMVKKAGESARDLQNLATQLDLTTRQAYNLSSAAKIVGVNIGALTMASRTLSAALEEPGGAGLKTADALTKLGVSLTDSSGKTRQMGDVLQETMEDLAGIADKTERARLATEIFGRGAKELLPLIDNYQDLKKAMGGLGESINDGTTKELLEADKQLNILKLHFEDFIKLVAGGIAVPINFIVGKLNGTAANTPFLNAKGQPMTVDLDGQLKAINQGQQARNSVLDFLTKQDIGAGVNHSKLHSLLAGSDGDLEGLQNRVQETEKALKDALETAKNTDQNKHASQQQVNAAHDTLESAMRMHQKAEAALQAARKAAEEAAKLPQDLQVLKDRVAALHEANESNVQRLLQEQAKFLQEHNLRPGTLPYNQAVSSFGQLIGNAEQLDRERDAQKAAHLDSSIENSIREQAWKRASSTIKDAMLDTNSPFHSFLGLPKFPSIAAPMSATQAAQIQAIISRGTTSLRTASGADEGSTAAENLNDRLREIQQNLKAAVQEQSEYLDGAKLIDQLEKDRFEAAKQGLEATIQYETQLAAIRQKQEQETKSFLSGWFNAAISGRPSATTNFFHNYGMHLADQIVGNIGVGTIGTLNSRLTLQPDLHHTGILGSPDKNGVFQANWFGKMLAGTPLGVDASKGSAQDLAKLATDKNTEALSLATTATKELASIMGRLGGIDTSSLPGSLPIPPAFPSGGAQVQNESVRAPFASLQRLIGGPGLTSGFSGRVGSAIRNPISILGGMMPSIRLSPVVNVPGSGGGTINRGTAPVLPAVQNSDLPTDLGPMPSLDLSALDSLPDSLRNAVRGNAHSDTWFANSPMPTGAGAQPLLIAQPPDLGINASNVDAKYNSNGTPTGILNAPTGVPGASQDADTSGKIAGVLGNLMGGAKYGTNGYGLQAVLTGQGNNGPGSMTNLSTSQRIGAGLGLAGQEAGGITAAVNGFGKGGARGDIQGIAGTLTAAAPFTGPAAPFVMAAGAIMGLVSSLFPDPREQRRHQEQGNMAADRFIEPASRDYNFTAGTDQGFSLGNGGSIQQGGQTVNYTATIHAMDAGSFLDFIHDNPAMMAQAMLSGLQSGGIASLDQELAWRAQYGGKLPQGWSS